VAAQDYQFSQQYANRLQLNPAFTGLYSDYSVTAAYRRQWYTIDNGFITNQLTADYKFKNKKTAAGLLIALDKAGSAGFTRFELGGIYAYQSNLSEQFAVSAALQASYGSQRFRFNDLIFGDQLDENGTINPVSQEDYIFDPSNYLSVAAGGILYNNQFWLGLAAHHVNQPNVGFNTSSVLPVKFSLHSGYKFYVSNYYRNAKLFEFSLTPIITYTQQQNFKKTDLGLYATYTPLTLGLIYNGLPIGSTFGYNQSLTSIAGIVLEPFRISYSYGVVFSGLGSRTGGAHEIVISFDKIDYDKIFKSRASRKNYKHIACPAF
jgi:type IX secretion system PorP/SprF family membrane protein